MLNIGLLLGLTLIPCSGVVANDNNTQHFTEQFFSKYAVQTALDMSQVIPGFHADFGQSVRGFTGGGGNILIDGKRPSVKSGDISDILKNIPAKDVFKIELIIGSAGSGDAAQKSSVINIVRVKTTSSLRVEVTANHVEHGKIKPELLVNYGSHWQDWAYQVNSLYKSQEKPVHSNVKQYDALGKLANSYQQSQVSMLNEYTLATDASRQMQFSQIDLFSKIKWSNYHPITDRTVKKTQQPFFHNDRESEYFIAELGVDYGYQLANDWHGRIQGIFLANHWTVERQTLESVLASNNKKASLQYDYDFERNKTESIIKGTWRNTKLKFNPEFGGELAYNQSKFSSDYYKTTNGITLPVTLNAANVTISELRSDLFLRGSTALTPKLKLNVSLAAEYSTLAVSGEVTNEEDYIFLKPSLAFIYTAKSGLTWQTQLQRTVGQLDFRLFAAQSNQVDNRNTAGNPALKPDSNIRLSTEFNYAFTNKAAITTSFYHDWKEDVLEQVVLPSGQFGTGNAGDAKVVGFTTQLSMPLDPILPRGQLFINAGSFNGKFIDPTTGISRQLTGAKKPEISTTLRQDNVWQGVSWGTTYTVKTTTENFYVNEYNDVTEDDSWSFFVEKSLLNGWRIKLDFSELGNPSKTSRRQFYPQNRTDTQIGFDNHNIQRPWQINLSASIVI
jgi:hypothetical protein